MNSTRYHDPTRDHTSLTEVELNSIISLGRAAQLSGVGEDTWRRDPRPRTFIIKISDRRGGFRLKHALLLER